MQYKLKCDNCSFEEPETEYFIDCPKCAGMLHVNLIGSPLSRTRDLTQRSVFKYHRMLPIEANTKYTSLEFIEDTPQILDEEISNYLDLEVHVKDETVLPTGTWKDREGFISLLRLVQNNVSDLVVFSSGNTGTSLARSASIFKGPRIHLIVPAASKGRIENLKEFYDPEFVKVQFFDGSNDECIERAKIFAAENNFITEGGL